MTNKELAKEMEVEAQEMREINWTSNDEMIMLGEMHLDRVQEDVYENESD